MSGGRRLARERALQALYQVDLANADAVDALRIAFGSDDREVDKLTRDFAEQLVQGVLAHLTAIDQLIQKHSAHWRLERMAKIDRNVLRLAAFELLHLQDVPGRVVINEAVELGKGFSTEESSAFINAILDKIAQELARR